MKFRMKSGVAALDGKIYIVGGCVQELLSVHIHHRIFNAALNRILRIFMLKLIIKTLGE